MTSAPEIAVIGGRIGGLATAAFLRRAGLGCTVYEQARELKEIGAGLVVAPNLARLLRQLGVMDALAADAVCLDIGWEFRRWQDGSVLSSEDLRSACEDLYGERTYTVHRADLLAALASVVPPETVRLGARCVSIEVGSRVTLRFADGTHAEADVVIGADGVHSVVRATFVEAAAPVYSGICAFRALVPASRAPSLARRRAQTLWIGPDHHLVHYPVSSGKRINLVAFAPAGGYSTESWTATATLDEFLTEFEGWDERLLELIRAGGTPGRWALLDRAPLTRWSHGPVTLLGDAAHPMFPFFGQGAAQSVEDAAVLAGCLASASSSSSSEALRRYESLRIPRTTRLQEVSHGRAYVNHLPDGVEQRARDAAFAGGDPLRDNGWIYSYSP